MKHVVAFVCSTSLVLTAVTAWAQTPTYDYEVLNRYPHDVAAFTEGLVYTGSALYESTGLYGSSTLRQVDLRTGTVLRAVALSAQYFGEGATIFQGKIFQLTWQSQTAFVYDPATFAPLGQFFYVGEGWGLTHDDRYLIMSDGTNQIRFVDPATFQTVKAIAVHDQQGAPLTNINELEYINGQIYANIWQTDLVARIDPSSGLVVGWIDFTGLLPAGTNADVLNGIAYDEASGHLLVTGKFWPYLFEVRLTSAATVSPDGTLVPTVSQIVDSSGAIWTIAPDFSILRNRVPAAGGIGSKILWKSSTIYVYGLNGSWYQWTGSGWLYAGTSTPGGTGSSGGTTTLPGVSSDGTTIPTATQIVDNVGAVWTLGSSSAILRNGAQAAGGIGSTILWTNNTIYVYGLNGSWYQWDGSAWLYAGSITPVGTSGGSTASPDGTMIPTATQIVDSAGAVWTLGPSFAILRNGTQAAGGIGSKILWKSGAIYVYGLNGNWYSWNGSGWAYVGPNQP